METKTSCRTFITLFGTKPRPPDKLIFLPYDKAIKYNYLTTTNIKRVHLNDDAALQQTHNPHILQQFSIRNPNPSCPVWSNSS